MEKPGQNILSLYRNTVRVRTCGICIVDDKILLAGHHLPGHEHLFWAPPGGGLEFGESLEEGLKREFFEETGLLVEVGVMLFVNEFIDAPLHAIEFFFEIRSMEGNLVSGHDPEFGITEQIINQVRFMTLQEIKALPQNSVHNLFIGIENVNQIAGIWGVLRNPR